MFNIVLLMTGIMTAGLIAELIIVSIIVIVICIAIFIISILVEEKIIRKRKYGETFLDWLRGTNKKLQFAHADMNYQSSNMSKNESSEEEKEKGDFNITMKDDPRKILQTEYYNAPNIGFGLKVPYYPGQWLYFLHNGEIICRQIHKITMEVIEVTAETPCCSYQTYYSFHIEGGVYSKHHPEWRVGKNPKKITDNIAKYGGADAHITNKVGGL